MTFVTRGGACISFQYNNKEFTSGKGMFEDLFWETPNYSQGEFVDASYQYEILANTPEKAVIRLWGSGSGAMKLIEYSKTITLLESSSLVRIDYEIRNMPENMGAVTLTPWIHNMTGLLKEKNTYFFPEPSGVNGYVHDTEKPLGNLFILNAVQGWTGIIGESKTGLALILDYRYLKQFYNCFGKSNVSVEWMMGPVKIKNGESFKTTFYLHPFHGLNRLNGVSSEIVGELELDKAKNLIVKFSSVHSLNGKIVVQYRRIPDTTWTDTGSFPFEISADKIHELEIPCKLEKDGTYLFKCTVSDEKNSPLVQLEKLVTIGAPSGNHEFKPGESKLIKEQQKYSAFNIKEDVVTPHITWAKPYAGGKIKALFIIDAVRSREIIELSERLALEYSLPTLHLGDPFFIGWAPATAGWSDGIKEMEPLIAQNHDCIFVSGFHHGQKKWASLTDKATEKILQKTYSGTGLIYLYTKDLKGKLKELYDKASCIDEHHFILSGDIIVPRLDCSKIKIAEYGKGRIVFIDYPGSPITPHGIKWPPEFNYWDYTFSFIAKAMIWASHKETAITLERPSIKKDTAVLNIKNSGKDNAFSLELNIMDKDGELEFSNKEKITLTTGNNVQSVNVPRLKNGMHFLNFYIKNLKGETVNWTTTQLHTEQDIKISSLKLDSDYCAEEKKLTGVLKVKSDEKEEKNIDITVRWLDAWGRIASEKKVKQTLKDTITEIPVSVFIDKSYSVYNQLIITIDRNGKDIDKSSQIFFISIPQEKRWKNYPVLVWHHSSNDPMPGYIHYYYTAQVLKKLGVDSLFSYNALPVLTAGMNVYLTGLYRQNIDENVFKEACDTMIRKPCLSDPHFLEKMSGALMNCTSNWRKYSPTLYGIGDENSITSYEKQCDICISKYCLPRFQEWLMERYGSLEKLNLAWDTGFSSVKDIKPLNYKQITERKIMNFSPWADHRTFMDSVFSDTMKFCKEQIKLQDSQTAVGECGTSRDAAYGGWDWYKRLQVWEVIEPYSRYGNQLEIQRSFFKGNIAGYTGYREGKFGLYCNWWWGLLHGEKGISLWFTPLIINPDLSKTEQGEAVEEYATGELKKGIGMLVSKSVRLHDKIAIHYSQPSLQASYILKNNLGYETLKQYYDNRSQWLKLLEGMGLQYEFIASEHIENGKLADGEYKILILPLSRALSEKEAENIKDFVKNGGLLLADCQTGIFDEHVKIRKDGILDAVSGIERKAILPITQKGLTVQYKDQAINIEFFDPVLAVKDVDQSYPITGKSKKLGNYSVDLGKSEEKFNAVITNSYGKGKTVYLNMLPDGTPKVNMLLENILMAFVQPQVRVVQKDEKRIQNAEIVRFQCGDAELVAVFQDPQSIGINPAETSREEMLAKGIPAEIIFSKKSNVYNIRKGEYLGFTDSAQAQIAPGEALVFARLPYRINDMKLNLGNEYIAAGDSLDCRISMDPERGRSVVRLEVIDPDGNLSDCYTENLLIENGKTSLTIKTAINDKSGRWQIVARDIISGKKTVKFFEIEHK